jgi:schlafen family protein
LEFKRELSLDTDGQKNEAERDAQGMANAGGGVIVYGIEEIDLLDGGTGAGARRPIEDGTLYERLNGVLDARGAPRLVFDLHAIAADHGGVYLVLDVSGRRRPHQASDGRYYMRRGTQVRPNERS